MALSRLTLPNQAERERVTNAGNAVHTRQTLARTLAIAGGRFGQYQECRIFMLAST